MENMKLEFWGVRGTVPVSGPDKIKYGGHTICASLKTPDDEFIVMDAGTGIKRLGDKLLKERGESGMHIHLLLTHFHLDHIMGIPFFSALYSPTVDLTVYSIANPQETEKYLSGLMDGKYFPVGFKETLSRKNFKRIPEGNFSIGVTQIEICPLHHPQGSIAYKFKSEGKVIVFATDTEHPDKGIDERLASFSRGADIFIYDAMFTPEEYQLDKKGWGHSTWIEGTKLARQAEIGHLYLSHFNPDHSDEQIDRMISLAQEEFLQTSGAREEL